MPDRAEPGPQAALNKRAQDEAANTPQPTVRATEYAVNCLPDDDLDSHVFEVRVQYRGNDRYAVIRGGDMCLGSDGTWDFGVKPYDRDDAWLNAHRFDLDTALKLAKEQAPLVTVNGYTVSDALAMRQKRQDRHG